MACQLCGDQKRKTHLVPIATTAPPAPLCRPCRNELASLEAAWPKPYVEA